MKGIPYWYYCGNCGRYGSRLWRPPNTATLTKSLRCSVCRDSRCESVIGVPTNIPANPICVPDASINNTDVEWFEDLPAKPSVVPAAAGSHPMYEHDCTSCEYLGTYSEGGDYDLYVHVDGHPTVIARFGDEGSEYLSGLAAVGGHHAIQSLWEAMRLAVVNNLLPPDTLTGAANEWSLQECLERAAYR